MLGLGRPRSEDVAAQRLHALEICSLSLVEQLSEDRLRSKCHDNILSWTYTETYHKLGSTTALCRSMLEDFNRKPKLIESRLSCFGGSATGDHGAHHDLVN